MKNLLAPKSFFLMIFVASSISLGVFYFSREAQTNVVLSESLEEELELEEVFPHTIAPRSTFYSVLREFDVSPVTIHEIVQASKPIMNLGRVQAGTKFQINFVADEGSDLESVKFLLSPSEKLEIKRVGDQWVAEKIIEEVETRVTTFSGVVTSSLWESAVLAQMDPNLISELSEIFGWQVDFARQVRVNDRWRLSVEQRFVKGKPIGWGSIVAAEYENAGELYTATLFIHEGTNYGYFAPDGSSLRRMFLKSPMRFGRISSRFQMRRFHPVLKVKRPHLGVDYAAPIGTPVRSVGDGTITIAGWRGGGGNVVNIRHNSTYKTAYKHLHRFAKGIRPGVRVKQGQVIGYVGSTGLSTGPHLHFEFLQNGRFVDPLSKKFPSADPVPKKLLSQFKSEVQGKIASLPEWKGTDTLVRGLAEEEMVPQN